MADIKGRTIAATYGKLLYTSTDDGLVGNTGATTSVVTTDDMDGTSTASCLNLGIDRVGIGNTAPGSNLEVSAVSADSTIEISSFSAEPSDTGILKFTKGSTGTLNTFSDDAVNDEALGRIEVWGSRDDGTQVNCANIQFVADLASDADSVPSAIAFEVSDSDDASNPTERMRLNRVGYLGIGTNSPQSNLHIQAAHNTEAKLYLSCGEITTGAGTELGGIYFGASEDSGWTGASIKGLAADDYNSTDFPTDLVFYTTPDESDTETPRMTILNSGEVGIGTTAPQADFHIEAADSVSCQMKIGVGDGNNASIVSRRIETGTNYENLSITANTFSINTATGDQGTASAARLTITHTTGNVGINKTDPGYKLEVRDSQAANYVASFYNTNAAAGGDCIRARINNASPNDGYYLGCFDGDGGLEGGVRGDGDGTTSLYEGSDRRLKENILDLEDGLAMINQLKPRLFNMKKSANKVQIGGFIADEFDIIPKGVDGKRDENGVLIPDAMHSEPNEEGNILEFIQTISTTKVIPYLTRAIQELSAKVTALENA